MACNDPHTEENFYDAVPEDDVYRVDYEANFLNKVDEEKELVRDIFRQLREAIDARELELLALLEAVGRKIGGAVKERQEQLDKLQKTVNELSHSLRDNHMRNTLNESQRPVLQMISEIGDQCLKISKIGISADVETLAQAVRDFGTIEFEYNDEPSWIHLEKINSISLTEASEMYKGRDNPVWVSDIPTETSFIMKSGLIPTRQVAINRVSNSVAIADNTQECVHVFTQEGEYVHCVKPDIGAPIGVVFAAGHLFVTSSGVLAKISVDEWVVKNIKREDNLTFSVLDSWKDNVYVCLPDNTGIALFSGEDLVHNGVVSLQVESVDQHRRISDFKVVGNSFYILFCHSNGWLSEFSLFRSSHCRNTPKKVSIYVTLCVEMC